MAEQKIIGGGLATAMEDYKHNENQKALEIVLDFVERWNKQDEDKEVAKSANTLSFVNFRNLKDKD